MFSLTRPTFTAVEKDYREWLSSFCRFGGADLPPEEIAKHMFHKTITKFLLDSGYISIETDPSILFEAELCCSAGSMVNIFLSQLVIDMIDGAQTSETSIIDKTNKALGIAPGSPNALSTDADLTKDILDTAIQNIKNFRGASRIDFTGELGGEELSVRRPLKVEISKLNLNKTSDVEEFLNQCLVYEARQEVVFTIPFDMLDADDRAFITTTLRDICVEVAFAEHNESSKTFGPVFSSVNPFELMATQLGGGSTKTTNNEYNPFNE